MSSDEGSIVYSTEFGRMCPGCGKAIDKCCCKADEVAIAGDSVVRVSRQTKGRRGKAVTVISGVPLTSAELKRLARELKAKCGSGGTVKDGIIEIQGDHRQKLIDELKAKGWVVKLSGG